LEDVISSLALLYKEQEIAGGPSLSFFSFFFLLFYFFYFRRQSNPPKSLNELNWQQKLEVKIFIFK